MIYKTLHIKLKIEQRDPYNNNNIKHLKSVDSSGPEIIFCFTFIFFDYLALQLMSVYLLWWSGSCALNWTYFLMRTSCFIFLFTEGERKGRYRKKEIPRFLGYSFVGQRWTWRWFDSTRNKEWSWYIFIWRSVQLIRNNY